MASSNRQKGRFTVIEGASEGIDLVIESLRDSQVNFQEEAKRQQPEAIISPEARLETHETVHSNYGGDHEGKEFSMRHSEVFKEQTSDMVPISVLNMFQDTLSMKVLFT